MNNQSEKDINDQLAESYSSYGIYYDNSTTSGVSTGISTGISTIKTGTTTTTSGIISQPIWASPYNNGTTGGYIGTGYTTTIPSYTINGAGWYNQAVSYNIMELPIKSMPKMVYVNGRLLTLGVIGSEAECSYIGGKKIIFRGNVIQNIVNYTGYKTTISLQYKRKIYHYVINSYTKTALDVTLLSEIIL